MTGSVVVREDGAVTEVDVERLGENESIAIDLDHAPQLVGVPTGMAVEYADDGDAAEDVKAIGDGGTTRAHRRTRVRHRGLGLEGDGRWFAGIGVVLGLAASGHLWALSQSVAALVVFLVAVALGYLVFEHERGAA